jgi:hypothetical protein
MILVAVPTGETGGDGLPMLASDESFVAVWSIYDDGDVAPRWRIGGPGGVLRNPRGVAVDDKNKTILVSDKYLNGVLTFSFPEMFEQGASLNRNTFNLSALAKACALRTSLRVAITDQSTGDPSCCVDS